jgi:hypothetical protein
MVRTLLVITLIALVTLPAVAQNYGDGFGIGGTFLPDGSRAIIGKTRIGNSLGVEASVALNTFSDDDYSSTNVMFALGAQKFWNTDDRLQPYFAGRVSLRHNSSEVDYGEVTEESDDTSFGVIAAMGAEYFVSRRLSIEGEAGVGMYFGSFELSTGTRLAAFLYL